MLSTRSEKGPTVSQATTEDLWLVVTSETRRRLLVAAVDAFAERGFHGTSTRDIASRAGLSPAALYVHYATKEEVLFDISRIGQTVALESLQRSGAGIEDDVERLARLVHHFAQWHAEHHRIARVVQYELPALTAEHYAEVVVIRRRIEQTFRDAIAAGVRADRFDIPDIAGAALAILSLVVDVSRWFGSQRRRSPAQIGRLYAMLAVRMLGGA
jgi:AcrR family transcriptional regulator